MLGNAFEWLSSFFGAVRESLLFPELKLACCASLLGAELGEGDATKQKPVKRIREVPLLGDSFITTTGADASGTQYRQKPVLAKRSFSNLETSAWALAQASESLCKREACVCLAW